VIAKSLSSFPVLENRGFRFAEEHLRARFCPVALILAAFLTGGQSLCLSQTTNAMEPTKLPPSRVFGSNRSLHDVASESELVGPANQPEWTTRCIFARSQSALPAHAESLFGSEAALRIDKGISHCGSLFPPGDRLRTFQSWLLEDGGQRGRKSVPAFAATLVVGGEGAAKSAGVFRLLPPA